MNFMISMKEFMKNKYDAYIPPKFIKIINENEL